MRKVKYGIIILLNYIYVPLKCILSGFHFHATLPQLITPGTKIEMGGVAAFPYLQNRGRICSSPISIGENVWIGGGAIILKGVTIGNNSVIAAGSIVTRNVPANTIYMNHIEPRIVKRKEANEDCNNHGE
mgnify:CR=1 FL=1